MSDPAASPPMPAYPTREPVDFVIVGSGAAGGVVARELSKAGFSVVLLEQGPHRTARDFNHDELSTQFNNELLGGGIRFLMVLLILIAALVVLMASTNVSNIVLAQLSARRRELSLRTALGAGRWDHVKQVMGEGFLLSAASVLGGGRSSRLYKALVYEQQVAQAASVYQQSLTLGSVFTLVATARPGRTAGELERAIDVEIARLRDEGPNQTEIDRARNTIETRIVQGLERLGGFGGASSA